MDEQKTTSCFSGALESIEHFIDWFFERLGLFQDERPLAANETTTAASINLIQIDRLKIDTLCGKKWCDVRSSLKEQDIDFKVVLINDQNFGMTNWPIVSRGTLLICLQNTKGVAVVDSIVEA